MNQTLQALKEYLSISREAGEALVERRPVVALESTVIAHGLPHPLNLEVAARMEANVREGGATPATIAILDGKIHIGLSQSDLERIATAKNIQKASTRDLPVLLARGGNGATTVSATLRLASLVGIKVFATGGIGGVHRGWEQSLDMSPDLSALAAVPLVTVCSGAKAILDLPATLEWLETHGVPVLGYRTDRFPAFYTPVADPPLPVDVRVDTPQDVAAIYDLRQRLGRGGVLVCVPVPSLLALTKAEVAEAMDKALKAASKAGVKGRDVTPFLLGSFAETTGGRSLAANRALLENNASIAAEISKAITPAQYV
jgi:pseudouridine-5'-phosphate glycosidase